MVSMHTHISWCDSTWNPTTGCTKVSAGCDHCYAEALTNRLWGGDFGTVKLHPDRLAKVSSFTPKPGDDGRLVPRMVFINSMSDIFHDDIPDAFRDRVFDSMATMPDTVMQLLTKRPMTMRRYIADRFPAGVPDHLWLGVSVEDNRVRGRIDTLRRLKDQVGPFTAFLSVEPLIGPTDRHDYAGIDWVLIGGESGHGARFMNVDWARTSRDQARHVNAAIWFKQFGSWPSNPLYAKANGPTHTDRIRQAIRAGERQAWYVPNGKGGQSLQGEKGGATLDGEVLHGLPPSFGIIQARLNRGRAPARTAATLL